jgi:hypothetical protein
VAKTFGALLLAVAIGVGGALFVDVESDVVKNGIAQVMTRGFSGLSPWAAVEAIARPYAAVICVFVLPSLLERWGQVLLGSRERGTRLALYSLIVALIMAGFWRGA